MGAWAPADIQQRVPGTRPEISLGAKVLICYQKYQNIEIRFYFLVKIECILNQIDTFSFEFFSFPKFGTRPVETLEPPLICRQL